MPREIEKQNDKNLAVSKDFASSITIVWTWLFSQFLFQHNEKS